MLSFDGLAKSLNYASIVGVSNMVSCFSMVARVKEWINTGKDVRIFTARVDGGSAALALGDKRGELYRDIDVVKSHIEQWCQTHLGTILPVTNVKDFSMLELWDDRCVQVERNTGRRADGLE